MKVEMWFDPECPFSWMVSRWITSVAPARDLHVDWRFFSILLREAPEPGQPFDPLLERTRNLLRVMESVRAAGHAELVGDLYSRFGHHIHHEGRPDFDVVAELEALGLEPYHAEALDDDAFDDPIAESIAEALELTGPDVGIPIVAVTSGAGRVGAFGPVLTRFPDGPAGLQLWDALVTMLETPGFFQLQRTRTAEPDPTTIPEPLRGG